MFIFWEKSIKIIVIALDFFPKSTLSHWLLGVLFIHEFSICTSLIKHLVDHVSFEWGGGGGGEKKVLRRKWGDKH